MPDTPQQQEPLTQAEPVAVGDAVKAVIALVAYFGWTVPDELATRIVALAVAVFAFGQAWYLTRKAVTPEARAKAREVDAYTTGYATGEAVAAADQAPPPHATVVQVSGNPDVSHIQAGLQRLAVDITNVDVDPITGPPPAPTRLPPPPGLD